MAKVYHRSDLRAELVESGRNYIDREGHQTLSIRKLAEAVEVSTAAPYHHFADRRAVLVAIAERGFDLLRDRIADISALAAEPRDRLVGTSCAFLTFARDHQNMFDLMYDSELTRPTVDPIIERQYRRTYEPILEDMVIITGREDAARCLGDFWAMLFGQAFLRNRGMLRRVNNSIDDVTLSTRIVGMTTVCRATS